MSLRLICCCWPFLSLYLDRFFFSSPRSQISKATGQSSAHLNSTANFLEYTYLLFMTKCRILNWMNSESMHNKVKVGITHSRRGIDKPHDQKQPLSSLLDCIAFVGLSCRCLWTLFSSRLPNALGYAYLSATCDLPFVLERPRIRLLICNLRCTFRSWTS